MRAGTQRQLTFLVPRILVVVGVILILSALLDYLILLYPLPDFQESAVARRWLLTFASQMVDRGIIPLVGLVFLFTGFWTADQVQSRSAQFVSNLPLRIPALILASILGLGFLVLAPLHWNNNRIEGAERLQQIQEQAQTAETQLDQNLQTQVQQEQARINILLQNEAQLNEAISTGQISLQQATLLQRFIDEPGSLDVYLNQQAEEFRNQALEQIQTRQAEAEQQAKLSNRKSGTRTILTSLLLAVGYVIVGWTGLKDMRTN